MMPPKKLPPIIGAAFVRASLVNNNPFLISLGRPTRETVSTTRESQSNLLQALELTNGDRFNSMISKGALIWKDKYITGDKIIKEIYQQALGRTATTTEYTIAKKKWYTGINFKAQTRSFQLSESQNNDYIRFDEVVLKGYAEYYFLNNLVAYCEIGHAFGDAPLQYKFNSEVLSSSNLNYASVRNYPLMSFGIAYRIREK
jgi:hypothetical protein